MFKVVAIRRAESTASLVLPLERLFSSFLFAEEQNPEIFVEVDVQVDQKRHVKPLAVKEAKITQGNMQTLTKYSFFESGTKWVKVRIPYPNAHNLNDKLSVQFKDRSFHFTIDEGQGKGSQFGVPKLQCRILPEASKLTLRQDEIQVTLRKKNEDDNWWSLFRQKATGELDSD